VLPHTLRSPNKALEQSDKHVFVHTLLECAVGGQRPERVVTDLGVPGGLGPRGEVHVVFGGALERAQQDLPRGRP
jgi:hypothetical protein